MIETKKRDFVKSIFKDYDKSLLDNYYAELDYDEVIGGRIINNTLQIRLSLTDVLSRKNLKIFRKFASNDFLVNEFNCSNLFTFITDLFVLNIKNKEYLSKYVKYYNKESSQLWNFDRIGTNKFEIFASTDTINPKDFIGKERTDFWALDCFFEPVVFEGSDAFFRVYEFFYDPNNKYTSKIKKYNNLNYGLDKFEKKINW